MAENLPAKNDSQIIIYQTEGGKTKIEVLLEDETVWLTQKLIAELFQTTKQDTVIAKNYLDEHELRGLNNRTRAIYCLCRRTGDASHSPAHERLDRETGRLFAVKRPKYSGACRKNIA